MELFNYAESLRRQHEGMDRSINLDSYEWIIKAREIAYRIACREGEVTINDVYKILPKPDNVSCKAVGSVFKDKRFNRIGVVKSEKVSRNASLISIWGIKNDL